MKKIFTILSVLLFATGAFAATEQAWYNDVTSITANSQYYIYSVKGKGFVQGNNSSIKTISTSNYNTVSGLLFTITNADAGKTYSGSYYLSSYQAGTCGPVGSSGTSGTDLVWTSMSNGSYWNIHGQYSFLGTKYAALYYDGGYSATANVWGNKETQTDEQYRWYLISPAHYDRHFAIYFFDAYKETVTDYTQYESQVPSAYYQALANAYAQTFSVKNAEHSATVVNAAKANLEALYTNAADVATAYANAKAAINALAAVQDKGEDTTQISSDITTARAAIEQAMTVEALNAAVSAPNLKAIDPVTFSVTSFVALQPLGTPASSAAGRAISYQAADNSIINAAGLPVYAGTTTLTATAAATDAYYAFVRSAEVTVTAWTTYGDLEETGCDTVYYKEQAYTANAQLNENAGLNYVGGDSILRVNIIVHASTTGQDQKTIVYGAAETWNGIDLSTYQVGQHEVIYTTTNAMGCDSVVTLALTVTKQDVVNIDQELEFCEGDSVEFRGVWYTEAGTFPVQVPGDVRDTLITVIVTVNELDYQEEDIEVIAGQVVLFEEEGWLLRDATPVVSMAYPTTKADTADLWFIRYFETEKGCYAQKVLYVEVEVADPVEVEQELEFCEGDSVEFRGEWYTEAGTDEILVEGEIRDTLITVTVIMHAKAYRELQMTDTVGNTIELPAGEWLLGERTLSGLYELQEADTLGLEFLQYSETEHGCEDLTVLYVTVVPKPEPEPEPDPKEGVENVTVGEGVQKFFHNGVLYIRRDDRVFTTEGREVK